MNYDISKLDEYLSKKKISLQEWLEMKDIPLQQLNGKVWIPLRVLTSEETGSNNEVGSRDQYEKIYTVAFPLSQKDSAMKLDWRDVGEVFCESGYYDDTFNEYIPVDAFLSHESGLRGVHLVLDLKGDDSIKSVWMPNQDLVATLGLVHHGDKWICPREDFVDVIRTFRDEEGEPRRMEIRSEYLFRYLRERRLVVMAAVFFSRRANLRLEPDWDWENCSKENVKEFRWEGSVSCIHEGSGMSFGEKWAIFHISRSDVDEDEDIPRIPDLPQDDQTESTFRETGCSGKKIYRALGDLWKKEWLEPPAEEQPFKFVISFIVDEKGGTSSGEELREEKGWLWFSPLILRDLYSKRGSEFKWYTKNTGGITMWESVHIHWGINDAGLINVLASDIGLLPAWQMKTWAGHNVPPEGKISPELFMSQIRAMPAETKASEFLVPKAIEHLNLLSQKQWGFDLFKSSLVNKEIEREINRILVYDNSSFFKLAKNLDRYITECINFKAIKKEYQSFPKDWKGLKTLEALLAEQVKDDQARKIMKNLFRVNDLRKLDSHNVDGRLLDEYSEDLSINFDCAEIQKGEALIQAVLSTLEKIIVVVANWK